jgi:hypothetical protein
MIISIFRLPKLQIRILLEKITNHNHSNMKIHLQRFILLFFLIPLCTGTNRKSDSRKTKHEVLSWFFNFYGKKARGKWLQIDKIRGNIIPNIITRRLGFE